MAVFTPITPSGSVESCFSVGSCNNLKFSSNRAKCDACPCCGDTCDNIESCLSCQKKQHAIMSSGRDEAPSNLLSFFVSICSGGSPENYQTRNTYTMCELKRHNHADSAWILVGDTIYDATPYIRSHPGGMQTILRKAGGAADCTEDLHFHSGRAQKEWRRFKIGTLVACPGQSSSEFD